MPRPLPMQIFSIFGECEQAAAEHLISKYSLRKIEPSMIPPDRATNTLGQPAKFAVIIPGKHVREFEQLCSQLRA